MYIYIYILWQPNNTTVVHGTFGMGAVMKLKAKPASMAAWPDPIGDQETQLELQIPMDRYIMCMYKYVYIYICIYIYMYIETRFSIVILPMGSYGHMPVGCNLGYGLLPHYPRTGLKPAKPTPRVNHNKYPSNSNKNLSICSIHSPTNSPSNPFILAWDGLVVATIPIHLAPVDTGDTISIGKTPCDCWASRAYQDIRTL